MNPRANLTFLHWKAVLFWEAGFIVVGDTRITSLLLLDVVLLEATTTLFPVVVVELEGMCCVSATSWFRGVFGKNGALTGAAVAPGCVIFRGARLWYACWGGSFGCVVVITDCDDDGGGGTRTSVNVGCCVEVGDKKMGWGCVIVLETEVEFVPVIVELVGVGALAATSVVDESVVDLGLYSTKSYHFCTPSFGARTNCPGLTWLGDPGTTGVDATSGAILVFPPTRTRFWETSRICSGVPTGTSTVAWGPTRLLPGRGPTTICCPASPAKIKSKICETCTDVLKLMYKCRFNPVILCS